MAREVIDMLNWEFNSCPRCRGDLFIDYDLDGWFQQCLQCGYRKELKELKKEVQPVGVERVPVKSLSKDVSWKQTG